MSTVKITLGTDGSWRIGDDSTAGKMLPSGGAVLKYIEIIIHGNGASGSAETINWTNGAIQKVSMTDDCTFTFTNPIVGVCRLFVNNNDPLGPYTATWPGAVIWLDSTSPTFTKNRTGLIEFYYDGTNYYGQWNEYY